MLTTGVELNILIDDWRQMELVASTDIAFGGKDTKTLIIASLCSWSTHTARVDVPGLPVSNFRL